MIGCVMSDYIIPKRYQQAHNEGIERFLASGQGPVITRRVELAALHKEGFELPVELTINALQTENKMFFGAEMRTLETGMRSSTICGLREKRLNGQIKVKAAFWQR